MTNRQFAQQIQREIRSYNLLALRKCQPQFSMPKLQQDMSISTPTMTSILNGSNKLTASTFHHALGLIKQAKYKLSHHSKNLVTLASLKSSNHGIISHVSNKPLSSQQSRKQVTHNVITSIQQQKHNPKRFNIFVDYKYAFPAGIDIIASFYLHPGQVITKKLERKIHSADTLNWLLTKITPYVTHGMHTKAEVASKLSKYSKNQNAVIKVIKKLEKAHLVNDRQYAIMYVKTQIELSSKGPQQIKRYLQHKGLSPFIVATGMHYYSNQSQFKNAQHTVKQLSNRYKYSDYTFKKSVTKIKANLSRKGYPFSIISKVIASAHLHPDYHKQKRLLKQKTAYAKQKYHRFKAQDKRKYRQKVQQYLLRQGFNFSEIND